MQNLNSDEIKIIADAISTNFAISSLRFQTPSEVALAKATERKCEDNRKAIWKFDEMNQDLQNRGFLEAISKANKITKAIQDGIVTAEEMYI